MSFTLGSHIAVFIAMFVSPVVAVCVELGTTLGFLLAGFSPVVVLRALAQIVFVVVGSVWLQKKPETLNHWGSMSLFVLGTGLLHGIAEALVSTWFYFGGNIDQSKGFFITIVLLVGVGTLVHHTIDFVFSVLIWKPVEKIVRIPAQRPAELEKELHCRINSAPSAPVGLFLGEVCGFLLYREESRAILKREDEKEAFLCLFPPRTSVRL